MANENEKSAATAQAQTGATGAQTQGEVKKETPVLIEGYGENDLVDYEDWRNKKVSNALRMMRAGYGKPLLPGFDYPQNVSDVSKLNDEDIYGATKYFGDGYHTTDHKGFFDKDSDNYFSKLGYEITFNPKTWRQGDLVGSYGTDGNLKTYSMPKMYAGKRKVFDYNGTGDPVLTNVHQFLGTSPENSYRLRFVGTQDDVDKINAHNKAIRQQMHGANINAMPGLEYLDYVDEPTALETVGFLNRVPKKQ